MQKNFMHHIAAAVVSALLRQAKISGGSGYMKSRSSLGMTLGNVWWLHMQPMRPCSARFGHSQTDADYMSYALRIGLRIIYHIACTAECCTEKMLRLNGCNCKLGVV